MNGNELDATEQSFAVLGAVSFGFGSKIGTCLKVVGRLIKSSRAGELVSRVTRVVKSAERAKMSGEGLSGLRGLPATKASDVVDKFDQGAKLVGIFIGEGGRFIRNRSGDVVILSKDGNRRVRFDIKNPYPHKNPHTHVELRNSSGNWEKSGPVYPTDVPSH